jgi:seryl-tRNA(Sec) selenium transferase
MMMKRRSFLAALVAAPIFGGVGIATASVSTNEPVRPVLELAPGMAPVAISQPVNVRLVGGGNYTRTQVQELIAAINEATAAGAATLKAVR